MKVKIKKPEKWIEVNDEADKSGQKEIKTSGISISCTTYSPGTAGIRYPDTYSLIKGHPSNNLEFILGDFDKLTLFSEELAGYVKKIKQTRKGDTV